MSGANSNTRRAKRCRAARRGEAHRRAGWVGGVYPSAPLTARTAASDGQYAFTRAARSAGLRFAVILLSKAMDVGRDHLIHRKRSPFPEKTVRSEELGVRICSARYLKTRFSYRVLLLPIAYCLSTIGRYTSHIAASEALPPRLDF